MPPKSGTLIVLRHAERLDYTSRDRGINWTSSASLPYDSPITPSGVVQSEAAGARIKSICETNGINVPSVVYTSPHLRCGETVTHAAVSISPLITHVTIELGLVESCSDKWYRSWASPGADSTWGGHEGLPLSKDVKDEEWNKLALGSVSGLFNTNVSMMKQVHQQGDTQSSSVVLPVKPPHPDNQVYTLNDLEGYNVKNPETAARECLRVKKTCTSLAKAHPGETVLCCTHGSPSTHIYEELIGEKWKGESFGYTCISIYRWVLEEEEGKEADMKWSAVVMNDTGHTDNVGNTVHTD